MSSRLRFIALHLGIAFGIALLFRLFVSPAGAAGALAGALAYHVWKRSEQE